MQCEACPETGDVRVTELANGKATDRWFCVKHAHEAAGLPGPTPSQWNELFDWLVPYFRAHGELPPLTEISKHGEAGGRIGKFAKSGGAAVLEHLRTDVLKRIAP